MGLMGRIGPIEVRTVWGGQGWPRRSGALQEIREGECECERKPESWNRTPRRGVRTDGGFLVEERVGRFEGEKVL